MMKWKNLVAVMLAIWGVSGCFEQDTKQGEDKKWNFDQIAFDLAKFKYERGDYFDAYKKMSIPAENGYAATQIEIAQMLLEGKGVRRNESAAVDWLKKAAEQKDAEALFKLGKYYQDGTIAAGKIIIKPCNYSTKPPSKNTATPNLNSACNMKTAGACRSIKRQQKSGMARRAITVVRRGVINIKN